MIRRIPPSPHLLAAFTLVALGIGGRLRAEELPAPPPRDPPARAAPEPTTEKIAEALNTAARVPADASVPQATPPRSPDTHDQPKPAVAEQSPPPATPPAPIAVEKTASPQPTPEPVVQAAPTAAAPTAAAPTAAAPTATAAPVDDALTADAPARALATSRDGAFGNEGIQSLLRLGKTLSDRADFESAEIAYYQVLNNDRAPVVDIKSALLGLGRMFRIHGSLTKAAAIYERFLKDYPDDERTPDALLDLGRTLRALGIYKAAITRFYSVINSTIKLPSSGFEHYQVLTKTAQFEIAETHFQSGDYAQAAKFYARLHLLDLAPEDRARAQFKAAYSLRLKGDLETAITSLRAYIDQSPDDENVPEARYLLSVTLREMKRTQEAFLATLELLRTEQSRVAKAPKHWAYWQRRTGNQLANEFFESGDTVNAQAIYTGLVDLAPEPTWRLPLIYQIALCYERLGLPDRARASYQSIIDTAGAPPPAELAEMARMAAWRLNHLAWRDDVARQVTTFFETTTGRTAPSPAPAAPQSSVSADLQKPTATAADIQKPAPASAVAPKPVPTSPPPGGATTGSTP